MEPGCPGRHVPNETIPNRGVRGRKMAQKMAHSQAFGGSAGRDSRRRHRQPLGHRTHRILLSSDGARPAFRAPFTLVDLRRLADDAAATSSSRVPSASRLLQRSLNAAIFDLAEGRTAATTPRASGRSGSTRSYGDGGRRLLDDPAVSSHTSSHEQRRARLARRREESAVGGRRPPRTRARPGRDHQAWSPSSRDDDSRRFGIARGDALHPQQP